MSASGMRTRAAALMTALLMALPSLFIGGLGATVSAATDENTGPNLALNKTVTASSTDGNAARPISAAVDGNQSTRWASVSSDPQWLCVDLGQTAEISRVIINWEAAYGKTYWIQVSTDNVNWIIVADRFFTATGVDDIFFAPVQARYVRMYGTSRATGYGYSIFEFEVYGVRDTAVGKSASVSSNADAVSAINDGAAGTAWTSAGKNNESFGVDLGGKLRLGSVRINWGANYASAYTIQVSDDGTVWNDAYTTAAGKGGVETINLAPLKTSHFAQQNGVNPATAAANQSADGYRDVSVQYMSARYVRVNMQDGPGSDYTVNELETYGNPWTVTPDTADGKADLGKLDLNGGWKLARAPDITASPAAVASDGLNVNDGKWIDAVVPGTVLTSYYKAGLIPDPYYSDNMDKLSQWYYNVDYWYRKEFTLPDNYAGQRVILNFEGVNWLSDVYVNGQRLGGTIGPFKREEFDVSAYLNPGRSNTIAVNVHIFPTLKSGGGVDDQTLYSPHFISSGAWDWIPAIPGRNLGIIKDVSLTTRNSVAVKAPFVTTALPLPDTSYADLSVSASLVNSGSDDVSGVIKGVINPGNITFQQDVSVPANSTVPVSLDHNALAQLRVQNPRLWWPNGYGAQPLYTMNLSYEIDGVVSDTASFNFGIRQYSYYFVSGSTPTNLQISCNGQKILCKGGNWGMPDAMLNFSAADYDTAVKMHADMNFTMIRSWLNNCDFDAFFDACDKYGIMVFTDFSIHGAYSPEALGYFIQNAQDKLIRDRNHPSIAVWCGANEWTPPGYLSTVLPQLCAQFDGSRIFILQSNKNEVSGGVTYSVNDPKWYYQQAGAHPGFTTEIGTPVIPNYESMEKMMPQSWWWPPNDPSNPLGKPINYMWQYHDLGGLADIGNKGAANYINAINNRYGASGGIEEFCLKAQMLNLETNRAMFESWNNYLWNKCSGILLWMSQSAWPSLMWQTYDKYFDSNGAYFGSKKACETVHVQYDYNKSDVKVINNSAVDLTDVKVTTELYNLDGSLFDKTDDTLTAAADSATQVTNIASRISAAALSSVYFIKLTLMGADGSVLSDNFYWNNKNGTTNYTALGTLPKVQLIASDSVVNQDGMTHMTVTLANNTGSVAVMTRLKVMKGYTNELVLPAYYDDNYFAMLPGQTKTVNIEFDPADAGGYQPVLRMEGFNTASAVISDTGSTVSDWELTSRAQLSQDARDGCVDVQATVKNYTDSDKPVSVFAAAYDADGTMVSMANMALLVPARSSASTVWFGAMDAAGGAGVSKIKVFAWDASDYAPLCGASSPAIQPAGTY